MSFRRTLLWLTAFSIVPAAACGADDGDASPAAVPPTADAARTIVNAKEDANVGLDANSTQPDASDADKADAGFADAKPDVPKAPFSCASASFPLALSVPEASASAEVELTTGKREMLVISDSGNAGVSLLVTIPNGPTRGITLALDTTIASDDVEGAAWRDGHLYTLTSSGFARRFSPDGQGGLTRDQDAYAIGADPYACLDGTDVNCGKNYEGLCLRASSLAHPCAGYAASKAEGKLYCLTLDANAKLVASTTVPAIDLKLGADKLSDCAFGTPGGKGEEALVVTTNVNNFSQSYRVEEATGTLKKLPINSLINNEAIAIDKDGSLYVFDDNSSKTSTAAKMECTGW